MTWTPLAPVAITTGRPMVSVAVGAETKSHGPTLKIILAATFLQEFGELAHAQVLVGSGENEGKLRIVFLKKPEEHEPCFELKAFAKGGAAIITPRIDCAPEKAMAPLPARVESKERTAFTLVLPVDEWARLSARPQHQAQPPAHSNGADASFGRTPVDKPKLDVCGYLRKKTGKPTAKMAGPWFEIDGERTHQDDVIKLVNRYRAKEGLGGIDATQIAA